MMKNRLISEATKAVLPTPTLLLTVHVEQWALLAMEFKNQDPTQSLSVEIRRRASRSGDYSVSAMDDFALIAAGVTKCADMDVRGCIDVQFWGTASGAGLTCRSAGLLVEGL